MITRVRNYPHPVLSPLTDDVTPNEFTLSLTVSSDADHFFLDVSFAYENDTLSALVAEGSASHLVHIECKRNFFREIVSLPTSSGRLVVAAHDMEGRIEVSGFITANQELSNYTLSGAHADYGDTVFDVRVGDVLAAAPSLQFDAYIDYDPLSNVSSILDIRRWESSVDGKMDVDFSEHRIVVKLSVPDFDRYRELKADPSLAPLLANQVVIPAMLEALHHIMMTPEEDWDSEMDRRWFRSVYKKLLDVGIDLRHSETSALGALQEILKLPLRRSLEGLFQLNPLETDE